MNKQPDPFLIDDDCPELTEADFDQMIKNRERMRRMKAFREQKAATTLVPDLQTMLVKMPA